MSDYSLQRKLEPIYDVLDNQNFKTAIQLCNKALRKSGPTNAIQALKAFALSRSGCDDEALDLCNKIMALKPTDAPTVQALMLTFKFLNKNDRLVVLYEQAFAALPNNEEWANHWFMALVRINDLKGYQQAAMKLHKTFQEVKYYFWAVMSIYLQSKIPDCPNKSLLLSLAQKMMEKAEKNEWISTPETLHLYMMILEEQSKYTDMEKLVSGKLGGLLRIESERDRVLLESLVKRNDHILAIEVSLRLLTSNIDDWFSYVTLSDSLLELKDDSSRISKVWATIATLQERALNERQPCRGPFLAELLLISKNLNRSTDPSISQSLLMYLKRFGKAQSCFDDMKPYLNHCTDEELRTVVDAILSTETTSPEEDTPKSIKIDALRRDINARKIIRFASNTVLLPTDRDAQLTQLIKCYHDSIPLGAEMDVRELQPGDEYLVISTEYILELYSIDRDEKILVNAIGLLEFALEKSKYNHQFKLLLIRMYFEIGVYQRAIDLSAMMDIKQIQTDTLSYIFTDDLEIYGSYNQSINQFLLGSMVYTRNEKELPESIIQAFKYASFSKIPEFMLFQEKLSKSIQRIHFQHQIIRSEIISKTSNMSELKEFLLNINPNTLAFEDDKVQHHYDNRDFTVLSEIGGFKKSLASKIMATDFPRTSSPWRKMRSLVVLLLQNMVSNKYSSAEVATMENQLEVVVATLPDHEAIPAKVILHLSRLSSGRLVDQSEEKGWKEVIDLYTSLTSIILDSNQFGLSRCFAENMTGVIEASTYIYVALLFSSSNLQSSKMTNRFKTKNDTIASAYAKFIQETKAVHSTIKTRLNQIAQMDSKQIQAHFEIGQSGIKTDLIFLTDTQAVNNMTEFIQRGWTLSFKGYQQSLEHLTTMQ
ncbi:mitochondrial distribution and morphology [Batrachochytrium dendrobatidis]